MRRTSRLSKSRARMYSCPDCGGWHITTSEPLGLQPPLTKTRRQAGTVRGRRLPPNATEEDLEALAARMRGLEPKD